MPSSTSTYDRPPAAPGHVVKEEHIEYGFIGKLQNLKYEYREDIRDRAALEKNFRERFDALNRVKLTDAEFARLLEEIVTPDVYTAAKTLRSINAFTRDDGTPLNYTLVSQKKVYYFESDELNADSLKTFDKIFTGLKEKYQFVVHAPVADAAFPAAPEANAIS